MALTAGTTLLMWLGELITQRGIGNGISLMIFASIASRIPNGIQAWWTNPDQVFVVMMPFIALAVIVGIVFVQEGQRRIPVQYAKRIVGRRMTTGGSTYLPLRVNMAGVIPVIFAASIMAFPPTIGQLLNTPAALDFAAFFSPNGWAYVVGEVFFIVIFTYFYTAVTFNPVDQADNLKKYGGFIPGVRPGRPTAEYLDRILSRLTFPGALYLGAIAALPTILINQTSANFFFGGTSILIVIGVALDTVKQLEAQLMMRNYEGFLEVAGAAAANRRLPLSSGDRLAHVRFRVRSLRRSPCVLGRLGFRARSPRQSPASLMSEFNLVLLGPPGSGKGTQGERLQEDFRLPYYATGDILRAAVRDGTELGTTAKQYMDRGDLVPDEVIVGLIAERVSRSEASDGFILDGFPRTIAQAEALDAKLEELDRDLTAAILIEVSDDEVVRRLSGRRTCVKEGHIFHVSSIPPRTRASATSAAPGWRSETTTSPR